MLSSPRLDLTLVTKLPVMENILSLSTELGGILPIALYSFFNVGGIVFGFFSYHDSSSFSVSNVLLDFSSFFSTLSSTENSSSLSINQLKQFSK